MAEILLINRIMKELFKDETIYIHEREYGCRFVTISREIDVNDLEEYLINLRREYITNAVKSLPFECQDKLETYILGKLAEHQREEEAKKANTPSS